MDIHRILQVENITKIYGKGWLLQAMRSDIMNKNAAATARLSVGRQHSFACRRISTRVEILRQQKLSLTGDLWLQAASKNLFGPLCLTQGQNMIK